MKILWEITIKKNKLNLILLEPTLYLVISKLLNMNILIHFSISAQLMLIFIGLMSMEMATLMLFAKIMDLFKLLSTMEMVIILNYQVFLKITGVIKKTSLWLILVEMVMLT